MTTVRTDLRETRESARRLRFEASAGIPATNVQNAIEFVSTAPKAVVITGINNTVSPYTVGVNDAFIGVDTSLGAVAVVLPLAAARGGRTVTVKDVSGNAVANPISVTFSGGQTADGLTTYLIDSAYGAARFVPEANGYAVDA